MPANKRISVFVPVYRESDLLEPLLRDLLEDPYEEKEIFIIIDEPTPKSREVSKRFMDNRVHFIFNGERRGKANVLNDVARESKGDIFLFLDSDTLIDGCRGSFLETISREMEDAEIIEIKKEVIRDSLIARVANYDYIGFNLTSWYFSHKMKRCLGINGAAFAIKRETFESLEGFRRVICEDLDLATRSFIHGARFKFIDGAAVYTKAPSTWREWFNQRKRWGIGAALWFKEHFKILRSIALRYPKVIVPSLLFIFPALPLLLLSFLIPDDATFKMLYISLILLSTKTSVFLPPAALTTTTLSMVRSFFIVMGNLAAYSLTFYFIARKFRFYFDPLEFVIFYFVMAPLWLLVIIVSLLRAYIRPENPKIDWKV